MFLMIHESVTEDNSGVLLHRGIRFIKYCTCESTSLLVQVCTSDPIKKIKVEHYFKYNIKEGFLTVMVIMLTALSSFCLMIFILS